MLTYSVISTKLFHSQLGLEEVSGHSKHRRLDCLRGLRREGKHAGSGLEVALAKTSWTVEPAAAVAMLSSEPQHCEVLQTLAAR